MNPMEKYVLAVRTIAPNNKFKFTLDLVRYVLETLHRGGVLLRNLGEHMRAMKFANKWSDATAGQPLAPMIRTNPLREYFDAHETGRGEMGRALCRERV